VEAFAWGKEEFGEFVAGAEAGELDGERALVGAEKMVGEVEDADGSADLRDEDCWSGMRLECGEEGFDGAIEGDEVAVRVGVGDGEREVVGELLEEEGEDAAFGADDVAETEGG
jgi:hypothetical protein